MKSRFCWYGHWLLWSEVEYDRITAGTECFVLISSEVFLQYRLLTIGNLLNRWTSICIHNRQMVSVEIREHVKIFSSPEIAIYSQKDTQW